VDECKALLAGASSMSSNALTLAANMAMVSGATTGAARAAAFAAALNAQHAAGEARDNSLHVLIPHT